MTSLTLTFDKFPSEEFPEDFPLEFKNMFISYRNKIPANPTRDPDIFVLESRYTESILLIIHQWQNRNNVNFRKKYYSTVEDKTFGILFSQFYEFLHSNKGNDELLNICKEFMIAYFPCPFCNSEGSETSFSNIDCKESTGHD